MNSFQNNILESTRNLKTGKVFIAWLTAGFLMLLLGLGMTYYGSLLAP